MSVETWFDESYPPSVLHPEPPVILPTGATAGTPGAWTPPGCDVPGTLAEANALGLSLGAAWTDGAYLPLDPVGTVYWDGTAFVLGVAPPAVGGEEETTATSKRRRSKASEEDA